MCVDETAKTNSLIRIPKYVDYTKPVMAIEEEGSVFYSNRNKF